MKAIIEIAFFATVSTHSNDNPRFRLIDPGR